MLSFSSNFAFKQIFVTRFVIIFCYNLYKNVSKIYIKKLKKFSMFPECSASSPTAFNPSSKASKKPFKILPLSIFIKSILSPRLVDKPRRSPHRLPDALLLHNLWRRPRPPFWRAVSTKLWDSPSKGGSGKKALKDEK